MVIVWITGAGGCGKTSVLKKLFPTIKTVDRECSVSGNNIIIGNYDREKNLGGYDTIQGMKRKEFYDLMTKWIEAPHLYCEGYNVPTIPMLEYFNKFPQILIFLDVNPEVSYKRLMDRNRFGTLKHREEYERKHGLTLHNKFVKQRRLLFEKARLLNNVELHRINVNEITVDEVANKVKQIVE